MIFVRCVPFENMAPPGLWERMWSYLALPDLNHVQGSERIIHTCACTEPIRIDINIACVGYDRRRSPNKCWITHAYRCGCWYSHEIRSWFTSFTEQFRGRASLTDLNWYVVRRNTFVRS